jgi:FtsP/CotA-like multicopper oxidase with cupredoxin domain
VQLKWAMNNISNVHGHSPLIGRVAESARNLGWPADVEDTVDIPLTPPFVWNYTDLVNTTDGPGAPLGTLKESIIKAKDGDVIEIVLQNARALNGAAEFHPWHIHGYSFWVVGQGDGIYNPDTDVATYNLVDPVLRDSVVLQSLGWVALRFVADNPGAWFFHCHIGTYSLSYKVIGV